MSLLLGRTVPQEFILLLSKSSKSLGDEKKLSINILCPKPSTLLVKCLTVECVTVMSSVAECESLPKYTLSYIQGVSRLVDITAGGDFLGLCDQKSSYKHVSDFGRLRSYDRLKLRIEGKDYRQ